MSEISFLFCVISDRSKQHREVEQASWLGGMTIERAFDVRPQRSLSRFVPIEVAHELYTKIPHAKYIHVNRRENTEQVLNIHTFRLDPL